MATRTAVARLAVATASLALAGAATASVPRALECPGGRFLVAASRVAIHRPAFGVIQIGPDAVTLDVTCAKPVVKVVQHRQLTLVRARWRACGSVRRLRVVARIAGPACDEMTGTMRAAGMGRRRFAAHRSTCGDRRFDAAVEQCDAGKGCAADERCTAACTCEPAPGSTTTTDPGPTSTTVATVTTTTTTLDGADCQVTSVPYEGSLHVPVGTDLVYQHNPPASGNHYPIWATYEDHLDVVPRGYWVHNLEHGAVVLLYRPDAPATVVDAVRAGYQAMPNDPDCGHRRALVTADPLLDVPFAAVAWDEVMECAGIVDTQSILDFTAAHRNQAPENECADGGYD